jgi:hypothetical protein
MARDPAISLSLYQPATAAVIARNLRASDQPVRELTMRLLSASDRNPER